MYLNMPKPRIILERCDDENNENTESVLIPPVLIDSDNEVDKSVEFVSEEPASKEIMQIARLNKKVANLQRELKVEKQANKDENEAHKVKVQGQSPVNDFVNNQQQCKPIHNSALVDHIDSAGPEQPTNNKNEDNIQSTELDQSNPTNSNGNDLSDVFTDSFIERTAEEWANQPTTIDDFIKFLEE